MQPAEALNRLPGVGIQQGSGAEHLTAIRSPVLTGGAGADNRLVQSSGLPRQGPHALDPLDNARPGDGLGAAGEIVEDLGW